MSTRDNQPPLETTGRYIITFREGATPEQIVQALSRSAGIESARVARSSDFGTAGVDGMGVPAQGAIVLENLGVATVELPPDLGNLMTLAADDGSPILAVEPERYMYALQDDQPSRDYLRGFRDAASSILQGVPERIDTQLQASPRFADTLQHTWGLQATRVVGSRFTGESIRVAILDTGLDLVHPDFAGRQIVSQSFVEGTTSAQDGHGHGTHCTGTACGPLAPGAGPRYGVAHRSEIYIGKVLSDAGRGTDGWILAGMDWAVANSCRVISMSLGNRIPTPVVAFEMAAQRALTRGSLVVAAAGNYAARSTGSFGFVGNPANCPSVLAVAAVDPSLLVADFSARDTVQANGSAIDIAGPGVSVHSSWPMPTRLKSISGTSMATPHVAGIAALWSQATGATGGALWQRLIANVRTLSDPPIDVGRGLVQAP